MRAENSAIAPSGVAVDTPAGGSADTSAGKPPGTSAEAQGGAGSGRGLLLAAAGVATFSLTFPGTAWGLEGFGPWSLVSLRVVLAALIAGGCLLALRTPVPRRRDWAGLAVVAGGCVLGFPMLTTLALETATTAHSAVVVGLLPLTTAAVSVLRTGARPPRAFWVAACAGAAAVLVFTVQQSGGSLGRADLYLFAALLVCAAGYAEGGRLASVMPGWQVIGWAVVLSLPLAVAGAALALPHEPVRLTAHSVAGLLWVSVGSLFLGMVVWYRGMALIGVPRASQLQLAQPLLTLVWSVTLLGEDLPVAAPVTAVVVLVCIAVTQRSGRRGSRKGRDA
ncbi:DMT family transporter [Streptomyces xanthii]|uniref:DMT family transporter n=1 Tax=Streptomyces xanthii TaxID=2768069 RepID=A0A7H1BEW3_9ACTN|nr:DMT family transporter [Streptomyces xanthii]QNS07268.1 DMT family transporter [Streptomyces xanthii]